MKNKVLLSGIQPSGILHIGNYLGAIKQWAELQKEYQLFAMIADLHAITVPQEPDELRQNVLNTTMLYIAAGIDPEKSTIFIQSHVPAHAELGWILNTITPLGELERMTQFKDKAKVESIDDLLVSSHVRKALPNNLSETELRLLLEQAIQNLRSKRERVMAGLFNYPTLMAADILLYQTDVVPVGEDQQQHIELTRSLAKRFNNRFGETFKIPEGFIPKETARIMGLDDPTKKMSKSAASANNYIALLDSPDEIRRKIKIAVTDSGKEIVYDEKEKPSIANLMRIFAAFAGISPKDIEARYQNKTYADFKNDLAELLIEKLSPIQKRYQELSGDKKSVLDILHRGSDQANTIAQKTLRAAQQKIGLLM